MALNKLTRGLNQLSQAFGSRLGSSFTPASISNLSYWQAGPSWSFSDAAGTVPCAVGDAIWVQKASHGPAINLVQATPGARPILRQDANGKYYREYAVGRWMVGTVTAVGANTPFAYCSSLNINTLGVNGRFIGNGDIGSSGGGMFISQFGGSLSYELYSGGGSSAVFPTLTTGKQSIIGVGTAVAASTPSMYKNGVLLSVTSNTHIYGARDANLIENSRLPASYSQGNDNHIYGSGFRQSLSLTVTEIAQLDAFQRGLYTP